MRALTEVQTDSVGGGLQFVGYTGSNGWDNFLSEIMGGMGNGGQITSGSYFSAGPSSSGSSSAGSAYGANVVNPSACNQDVFNAGLVGAGIGGAVGAYFGRSVPALGLGATTGALLGGFFGLKTSPNCAPK